MPHITYIPDLPQERTIYGILSGIKFHCANLNALQHGWIAAMLPFAKLLWTLVLQLTSNTEGLNQSSQINSLNGFVDLAESSSNGPHHLQHKMKQRY